MRTELQDIKEQFMKARFVALAVAATLGLGSVSAFAQDHHRHDGRGAAQWQQQRGNWGHNQAYAAPRHYAPSYNNYRRDDGDIAGALVLGAITGALLGQAANNNYYAPPATYYAPPATYYSPPATYYAPPANYYPGYGY